MAAGTGRNLPYYRYGDISSLTLADISPPMLEVAQAKYFDELAINFRCGKTYDRKSTMKGSELALVYY